MDRSPTRRIVGYGFALGVSGAALLLRVWLTAHVGPGLPTYLIFYPAAMLAATLYGLGSGLLATGLLFGAVGTALACSAASEADASTPTSEQPRPQT